MPVTTELKKNNNWSDVERLQTSSRRARAAWLNLCVSFKEASHQMSYFGQRLKIYFSCEREQLSNRLITILEIAGVSSAPGQSSRSPGQRQQVPEGSPRREGGGPRCNGPLDQLPSCRGGKKRWWCRRRARRGRGAGQAWVIGSGRRWHAAAEKVITWDWERNARSEEAGGGSWSSPVNKGQGPARVPSVFLAEPDPGCTHRGPGGASA